MARLLRSESALFLGAAAIVAGGAMGLRMPGHRTSELPVQCTSPAHSSLAWRQTDTLPARLSGHVVALDGVTPIRGARVLLEPGTHSVITGSDGSFQLEMPEAGRYRIRVRSLGFVEARDSVFLTGRNGVRFLVTLVQPEGGLREC